MLKTTTPKYSRMTTIRVDEETDNQIREMSAEKKMSYSAVYRAAIKCLYKEFLQQRYIEEGEYNDWVALERAADLWRNC